MSPAAAQTSAPCPGLFVDRGRSMCQGRGSWHSLGLRTRCAAVPFGIGESSLLASWPCVYGVCVCVDPRVVMVHGCPCVVRIRSCFGAVASLAARAARRAPPAVWFSHLVITGMALASVTTTSMSCALADKVPRAKQTGNMVHDQRAAMDRQHLIDCINMLWYHPIVRGDAAAYLRSQIELAKVKEVAGPDSFDEISQFGKIDETWLASFVASQLGIQVVAIGKAKVTNDRVVRELAQALTNIGPMATVPELCRSKVVMARTLEARIQQVGDRAAIFKESGLIKPGGVLDWLGGVYGLVFDTKGALVEVLHRPTATKAPFVSEVTVDASWTIVANYDDASARLEKGKTMYRLRDQFTKKQGPFAEPAWTGKAPKFQETAAAEDEKIKEACRHESPAAKEQVRQAFVTPLKEKQATQTMRAREKLAERKEESAKRRRVSLAPVASVVALPALQD